MEKRFIKKKKMRGNEWEEEETTIAEFAK